MMTKYWASPCQATPEPGWAFAPPKSFICPAGSALHLFPPGSLENPGGAGPRPLLRPITILPFKVNANPGPAKG
jgi:hypothetical protein